MTGRIFTWNTATQTILSETNIRTRATQYPSFTHTFPEARVRGVFFVVIRLIDFGLRGYPSRIPRQVVVRCWSGVYVSAVSGHVPLFRRVTKRLLFTLYLPIINQSRGLGRSLLSFDPCQTELLSAKF